MSERAPRVVVIGGGLAGMVVAKALAEHDVEVTILETTGRLGGKAGADRFSLIHPDATKEEVAIEHGFHFFPGWYQNTRQLLSEIGVDHHLIDTDTLHMLQRPAVDGTPPTVYSTHAFSSLRALLHNLFRSVLPWHQALMHYYFTFDLAAESFSSRGYLDRVSVSGFFRSRFYRNEALAEFHQMSTLQASSIPFYELSAMTMQKVIKAFMGTRSPMVSLLDGDLQTAFIEPFEKYLCEQGVRIHKNLLVNNLETEGKRVTFVVSQGEEPFDADADAYVLATPLDVTAYLAQFPLYNVEVLGVGDDSAPKPLSGLWYLRAAPMAALQVYFDHRLADIPPWHASCYQSTYGLSFIDISQHWPELQQRDKTVLSVIAANFEPLTSLKPKEQVHHLLDETFAFLGIDRASRATMLRTLRQHGDRDRSAKHFSTASGTVQIFLRSNTESQLFLNTTGAWIHRPDGRTAFTNLFVAGDYCRSDADLTTMESAVLSGLSAARAVLESLGKDASAVAIRPLALPPRALLVLLRYALLPLVAPIGLAYATQRAVEPSPHSLLDTVTRWWDGEEASLSSGLQQWLTANRQSTAHSLLHQLVRLSRVADD